MEAEERNTLLERSNALRQELKIWERDFAAANGSQKPGRDDIKQNPSIAQKYKEYTKSRDILSGKVILQESSSPQRQETRKRKLEGSQMRTPSKRLQTFRTPSKTVLHPATVDPYDSPSAIRNLFTPSKNKIFGPTPQKDGRVLGLFDLLDDTSPSKVTGHNPAVKLQETPRKTNNNLEFPLPGKHSRTPASSGKRFLLDSFATPLKGRHPNEQHQKTPSSMSKLNLATPSFLRRDSNRTNMPSIDESDPSLALSPQVVRLPKKPLVRGLSSILANLRKLEEEQLDDDLEALHEMESGSVAPVTKAIPKIIPEETVPVVDSQRQVPLSGFNDEGKYDSDPEELNRDGPNLKIWKKKGQKRTTRRVNMKPVRTKPSVRSEYLAVDDYEDDIEDVPRDAEEGDDAGPDTHQADSSLFPTSLRNFDSESGSEYTASEGGTRYRRPDQSKKRKVMSKDGKIRTTVKKVAAGAHANFKRLKLRNTGAKGGVAHNSRFRRKK